MPNLLNTGTMDIPLRFAEQLTKRVNKECDSEEFINKVSPITQDLLRFWFSPAFCDEREFNFHKGQKQAILNTIYCHEILKTQSVFDLYQYVGHDIANDDFLQTINKEKYSHPMYCIKMATGTGKTWCMHAIFLWQYLNAKFNNAEGGCVFTKNFLFIAPGLIVYERLLDAFLGKENENGIRDFETSDFRKYQELFVPEKYREVVMNFVSNNVIKKEDIGRKATSEGIMITNWHLLMGSENKDEITEEGIEASTQMNPSRIVKDLLPITPGTSEGHKLESLDSQYLSGRELEYLRSLENICVFNDEAHHIHENKTTDEKKREVEWQKSLNYISENKKENFIQIDFSATPYDVIGSRQKRTRDARRKKVRSYIKRYFPHIVVNHDLIEAVKEGHVKIISIDQRKETASIPNDDLDFNSNRNSKKEVVSLSDGQRLMLRAGLSRLKLLEEEFVKIDSNKHPKMLVMCEDTRVSPLVEEFMLAEGLSNEDIIKIDSNKKGEVSNEEWKEIKQILFNIDKKKSPKVIISVLMLREGFDVNNVCVIVPLRSVNSSILLEQVIGRGLRLMWRELDYREIKKENHTKILELKQEPSAYYDILCIIEHPAFIQFYEDLYKNVLHEERHQPNRQSILGDIITVGLKENYKDYDFYIPEIIKDREEVLSPKDLSFENFEELPWTLEQLKSMLKKQEGEVFIAQEMTVKTKFGEHEVRSNIFNAQSYNPNNGIKSLKTEEKKG